GGRGTQQDQAQKWVRQAAHVTKELSEQRSVANAMEIKIKGHTYRSEAELKGRVAALDLEHEGESMPGEAREEWNALNERIDEFEARRERIRELARTRRNLENGDGATFRHDFNRGDDSQVDPRLREARDA